MSDDDLLLSLKLSGLSGLSPRYQRLVREVYQRIPNADRIFKYRTIDIVESGGDPLCEGACADTRRLEAGETLPSETDGPPEQTWLMTLYRKMLDPYSDAAVRWVIAHEFGHIASGLRTGSVVVGGEAYRQQSPDVYVPAPSKMIHEDAATEYALMEWGFDVELQACLRESETRGRPGGTDRPL